MLLLPQKKTILRLWHSTVPQMLQKECKKKTFSNNEWIYVLIHWKLYETKYHGWIQIRYMIQQWKISESYKPFFIQSIQPAPYTFVTFANSAASSCASLAAWIAAWIGSCVSPVVGWKQQKTWDEYETWAYMVQLMNFLNWSWWISEWS